RSAETATPYNVRNKSYLQAIWLVFILRKASSDQRMHAKCLEEIRFHRSAIQANRYLSCQIAVAAVGRAGNRIGCYRFECSFILFPFLEIVTGQELVIVEHCKQPKRDQLVLVRVWQRPEQNAVD